MVSRWTPAFSARRPILIPEPASCAMARPLASVVDYGIKVTVSRQSLVKELILEQTGSETWSLAAGGIAALLAGACCLGPFVLVSVGLGGAWLSNFQLLEL